MVHFGKKPVYLLEKGLSKKEKIMMKEGIEDVLKIAEVEDDMWVETPNFSIEDVVQEVTEKIKSEYKVNASLLMEKIEDLFDGYIIAGVDSHICSETLGSLSGVSIYNTGIVSRYYFEFKEENKKNECMKTITMHELGHMFKLVEIELSASKDGVWKYHCPNKCIMRTNQNGYTWESITNDRINDKPFCNSCEEHLKKYFI